jgi:hypothetical protein
MPAAAMEAGAAVQAAVAAGEDMFVVVAVEVRAEQVDQELGWEDVADCGRVLRAAEFDLAADFVEGSDVGVDEDAAVVELGIRPAESGEFAPAHAGVAAVMTSAWLAEASRAARCRWSTGATGVEPTRQHPDRAVVVVVVRTNTPKQLLCIRVRPASL